MSEQELKQQALDEAATLFAHHGDSAADMLVSKVHDPELSATERRRYRLTQLEVERLVRDRRSGSNRSHALAVWRPPLFSWAGLTALFGRRRKAQPRRRR